MDETVYLRIRLRDVLFAVPADAVIKILSSPKAVRLPDAPDGICGIVYDAGAVFALRSLSQEVHSPARLAVLCRDGAECTAFAADQAETMGELTAEEKKFARPYGSSGILLLTGKETNDCAECCGI